MRWIFLILILSGFGCTSIPPESAKLSNMIGRMIVNAKTSHMILVNKHFDRLSDDANRFMVNEYKPAYLGNLRKIMKRDDPNFRELTTEQYDQAMDRLLAIRLKWISEVQKSRRELLDSLEEYYKVMLAANDEITHLLNTALGLEEARNRFLDNFDDEASVKARELETKLFESTTKVENMLKDQIGSILN